MSEQPVFHDPYVPLMTTIPDAPGPRQLVITITGGSDPTPRAIAFECSNWDSLNRLARNLAADGARVIEEEARRRMGASVESTPGATS